MDDGQAVHWNDGFQHFWTLRYHGMLPSRIGNEHMNTECTECMSKKTSWIDEI